MTQKLALGTVQFGLNYGINNVTGKVPPEEVNVILRFAQQNNINVLDTAVAYGNSETVIGEVIKRNQLTFNIVSKLPKGIQSTDVESTLRKSLIRLGVDKLYACLLHDFSDFENSNTLWKQMLMARDQGLVSGAGFSLYYPWQLQKLLDEDIDFNILQVPYSVFDRRFEPYFPELKRRDIEIHTRSVFLQGLFFKKPETLPDFFENIKDKLLKIRKISIDYETPLAFLLLQFAAREAHIDKIVVGVDNVVNLAENLNALKADSFLKEARDLLDPFNVSDEQILLPFNWEL